MRPGKSQVKTINQRDAEKLIKTGADENVKGQALVTAAEIGNLQVLKFLLEAGVDVNSVGKEDKTALMLAAYYGHVECVDLLIQKGADVNLVNDKGTTALMHSTVFHFKQSDEDEIRMAEKMKCFELLMQAGADVGERAMVLAVTGGEVRMVEMLIKADRNKNKSQFPQQGASVNKVAMKGQGLVMAAEVGDEKILRMLLEAGASVNSADVKGRTALMNAAHNGFDTCLDLLIQEGADVNLADTHGNTALLFAVSSEEPRCSRLMRQRIKIELLDISLKIEKYAKCTEALIRAGAKVNTQNNNGETPLMSAARDALDKCILSLLGAGADKNMIDSDGCTALNHAVLSRSTLSTPSRSSVCIIFLLYAGAHVNRSTHHDLQSHLTLRLKREDRTDDHTVMLSVLFAAGEKIDFINDKYDQQVRKRLNIQNLDSSLDLKNICRKAIRKHLLDLSPVNLFCRVPQLGLPTLLAKYLLYDVSLETEFSLIKEQLDD